MPDLSLAVIIPSTLNTPQLVFLDRCVCSLRSAQLLAKEISLSVFVVSTRKSSKYLREKYPDITFIFADQKKQKWGFADLNNLAGDVIQEQKKKIDWVLLINDDAYVEEHFLLHFVMKSAQLKEKVPTQIFAPLILEARSPAEIDSFGVEYFRSGYAKNNRRRDVPTTLATAGCLLIRWSFVKKMITTYGFFFNPIYFYYLEDVDLTIRARMLDGKITRDETLIAYHYGSSSSGGRKNRFALYHTYRNILWVLICCWPSSSILRHWQSILLVQLWTVCYGTVNCGVLTFPRIWWETLKILPQLKAVRKKTIESYVASVSFESLLSEFTFRTFHNKTVKVP